MPVSVRSPTCTARCSASTASRSSFDLPPERLRRAPALRRSGNDKARGKTMADAVRITKTTSGKKKPKDKDLAFRNVFTDHMFVADLQEEEGWYDPRVEPNAPVPLDPPAAVRTLGQFQF